MTKIAKTPLLVAKDLSIAFTGNKPVVKGVSFTLHAGEALAVVGESGSGKTMIARSIMQLLPAGGAIQSGSLSFKGLDLVETSHKQMRAIRGRDISMIFQEPMVSLNPALKIGFQMCEAMKHHTDTPIEAIKTRAIELLKAVRIQDAEACMNKYPHEFSGGMRQRIMIASSLMMKPALLIADEPTTALDCIVQKEVLDILIELTRSEGTALLLITHDLGLVAHYSDTVMVMEKGLVVEQGAVVNVLHKPEHPYTLKLLSSLPKAPHERLVQQEGDTLISVRDLTVTYPVRRTWFWQSQTYKTILKGISLDVYAGETLAIVGESGSGKTTLGRAILQLVPAVSGNIHIDGTRVTGDSAPGFAAMSDIIQLIFQDPYSALSPRKTIGHIIGEPISKKQSKATVRKAVVDMLRDIGLDESYYTRLPSELSGGQRQRVSIARALICKPRIVIADEPVSALDITVQAQILDLLQDLKEKYGFTCIFISHDLGVVEQVADRVLVMYHGHIVEYGDTESIIHSPAHSYTRALLATVPEILEHEPNSYALHHRIAAPSSQPAGYTEFTEGMDALPKHVAITETHYLACVDKH